MFIYHLLQSLAQDGLWPAHVSSALMIMNEWLFRGLCGSCQNASFPGFYYAGSEKTPLNIMPAITLCFWQSRLYAVLENNKRTIKGDSFPYFSIAPFSVQFQIFCRTSRSLRLSYFNGILIMHEKLKE